jgi:protein required for attachment to host cells
MTYDPAFGSQTRSAPETHEAQKGRSAMDTRWIMVADASRARVFRENDDTHAFEFVQTFEHEASRAHARDLMADANGRKPAGVSVGPNHGPGARSVSLGVGRVGVAPETDPKEVEAEKFARELSHYLEAQLQEHAYSKLILAAPPHFLGLLRSTLSSQVQNHIEATLHKDLTQLDTESLQKHVTSAQAS